MENNNNEYIPRYNPIEYKSNEWYLYHSRDNEGLATPLITISPLLLFLKSGIVVLIIAWAIYFIVVHINNEKLNSDQLVLKKREEYKESRKIYDPRDPKYQSEYYKKYPQCCPGTPEFQKVVDNLQKMMEEDIYKSM